MTTMILNCTCEHPYQDKLYGKGHRVFNFASKQGASKAGAWRCTVCSKLQEVSKKVVEPTK